MSRFKFPVKSMMLTIAAALILSGCGLVKKKRQPPCPRVTALKDTSRLVKFSPGVGTDLSDMLHEVRLVAASSRCSYRSAEVQVEVNLTIAGRRGPADTTRKATTRYFVAIMDPARRILNKREFDVSLNFPANVDRGSVTDHLVQTIPIPRGGNVAGHSIVVGLQLTPDELRFNRRGSGSNMPGRLRSLPLRPGNARPSGGEDFPSSRKTGPVF